MDHRRIIEERIVILGRDNPREIKRLLNSALLRAWAAAQDTALNPDDPRHEKERRARRFAQGAHVFLVQRFLWRDFLADGVLLRTQAQEFFARWSGFVARHPDFRPSELRREPFGGKEADQEAESTSGLRDIPDEDRQSKAPGKIADFRQAELDELERSQPVPQVLKNEDLWELMRIPFSVSVAGIVVAKAIPELPSDDEPSGGTSTRRPRTPGEGSASATAEAWPLPVWVAAARTLKKSVAEVTESDIRTLEHLDLSGNRDLADLTPLAGLTQLRWLHLHQTGVTDLTPLRKLEDVYVFMESGRDVRIPDELKGRVHRN